MAQTKAARLAKQVTEACERVERDFTIQEDDGKGGSIDRIVASVTLQGCLHLHPGKPLSGENAALLAQFLHNNFVRLS